MLCSRMPFECVVNGIDVGNLARFDRQVMAHEAIKMGAVRFLPEIQFHWPPELFVKSRLQNWLQSHQDKIADEVCLTQLFASRVHAPKNKLWVVLITG